METPAGKKGQDVAGKLAEALAGRNKGLVFDNLKLGEYLDRWLADSVKDMVKAATFERYEQIVRLHIKPALGRLKLKAVTPAHVRGLYRQKLEAHRRAPSNPTSCPTCATRPRKLWKKPFLSALVYQLV